LGVNTQSVLALSGIKNIIFDLGGVIINLSVERTHQAFASLSGLSLAQVDQIVHQGAFFHEYESGKINDADFRDQLRRELKISTSDQEIDQAWNAMLLDIPLKRIQLLEKLKKEFNVFLLSNTNNIHLQCFNKQVQQLTGLESIDHYFHRAYYSHLVKMRKPDAEIYEHVLQSSNLVPQETIFLDDNKDNLTGANQVGIQTYHVQQPDQIFTLF